MESSGILTDEGCADSSKLVSEDGKNAKSVLCQRCGSKVLCPGTAVLAEKEVGNVTASSINCLPACRRSV